MTQERALYLAVAILGELAKVGNDEAAAAQEVLDNMASRLTATRMNRKPVRRIRTVDEGRQT